MNRAAETAKDGRMGTVGKTRRRVLFIATDLSTGGGVNKAIRDQAVLFRNELDADVTVACARSDSPSTYAFPADVPVHYEARSSLWSYFRTLLRLRRTRPDFVISSWTQDNILVALTFAFSPTRVILVEHSPWHFHSPTVRFLRRIVYGIAWRVIALNPTDLKYYRRFLPTACLVPNPVPETGLAEHAREKLILGVGHLSRIKNFAHIVHAMARSRLEEQGWSLAIVGDGPERDALQNLIRQLGLKRATIHPATPHIGAWYERASLLLVTSRLEVFSLALAEAMQSGVVPIAYAADGPSYILEDFPEQLVPIGDVDRLAERLVRFARLSDLEPLRHELRRSIQARFSPEIVAAQWKELLEEASPCQQPKPC